MRNRQSPLVTQLTWTHYLLLLPIKDQNAICYYVNQISKRNLLKRQLEEIIKSKEYERLPKETKNKLSMKLESNIIDFVKNPIIIKNSSNYEIISEKILQKLILEDIEVYRTDQDGSIMFKIRNDKLKIETCLPQK